MKCTKCGTEFASGEMFCVKCGTPAPTQKVITNEEIDEIIRNTQELNKEPEFYSSENNSDDEKIVEEANETVQEEPKKKKKSKLKIFLISLIIFIVLVFGATATLYFISPYHPLSENIKSENYEESVKIYNEQVANDLFCKSFADTLVNDTIKNISQKCNTGEYDYEIAKANFKIFESLSNTELSKLATNSYNKVVEIQSDLDVMANADSLVTDNKYKEALEAYSSIVEDSLFYQESQDKTTQTKDSYKNYILEKTEINADIDALNKSLALVNSTLEVLAGDEDLIERKTSLETQIVSSIKDTALENAQAFMDEKDYLSASSVLYTALQELVEDVDIQTKLEECENLYLAELEETVKTLSENCEIQNAIDVINSGRVTLPEFEDKYAELIILIEENAQLYLQHKVTSLQNENKFYDALNLVDSAMTNFPTNETFSAIYESVKENMPTRLMDLKASENEYFLTKAQCEENQIEIASIDINDNSFTENNVLYALDGAFAKYNLDETYSKLLLTLAVEKNDLTHMQSIYIKNSNGEIIFSKENINNTTVLEKIEIDISSTNSLEFDLTTSDDENNKCVTLLITDAYLIK